MMLHKLICSMSSFISSSTPSSASTLLMLYPLSAWKLGVCAKDAYLHEQKRESHGGVLCFEDLALNLHASQMDQEQLINTLNFSKR